MKLIIGLGNPGEKYKNTRHNVGFMILDKIQKSKDFSAFEFNKKFNAFIAESNAGEDKIILAKPQTFMNNSGQSVKSILDFYKISPQDLIIINDDLDITIGNYKIAFSSSSRGHNGIQSILDHIGDQEIKRVKVGVEKESGRASRKITGKKFVLEDFLPEELEKINSLTDSIEKEIV